MKVQIDNREPESVQKYLKTKFEGEGCDVEICQLEVGDIVFPEYGYCIERKTVPDFFGSARCGRLDTQVQQMQQYAKYMILIIGNVNFFTFTKILKHGSPQEYYSYYRKYVVEKNCPIVSVENQAFMWSFLSSLLHHIKDEPKNEIVGRKICSTNSDSKIGVLACIPGVGNAKAQKIIEKYKTIYAVIIALQSDSFEIEGIGNKIRNNMKVVLFNE